MAVAAPTETTRQDLRRIASRQRAIIFCILLYLAAGLLLGFSPQGLALPLLIVVGAAALASTVLVFLLATEVYGTGFGVLLGLLTLVPLLGLLVLLAINGKATRILRQHGISVGFFGASAAQLREPAAPV